jgi:hypothetical protein
MEVVGPPSRKGGNLRDNVCINLSRRCRPSKHYNGTPHDSKCHGRCVLVELAYTTPIYIVVEETRTPFHYTGL